MDIAQRRKPEDMSASDYLNPQLFTTGFDDASPYGADEQYRKGLAIGSASEEVVIAVNSTWSARGLDGSSTTSYEKIGFHANTADLLRGFIDSGCQIRVWRIVNDRCAEEVIQHARHAPAPSSGARAPGL